MIVKLERTIKGIARVTGFVIFGLLLLLTGVIGLLYSGWAQNLMHRAFMDKYSTLADGSRIELDGFRLRFPLRLTVDNLTIHNQTDTLVAASSAYIHVNPLPLLMGEASIRTADLRGVKYVMGSPDSAMFLTMRADSIGISPASVKLASMDIDLQRATIRGGRLAMTLGNDTTPSPPSEPTRMSINIGNVYLDDFDFSMRMMPTIDTISAIFPQAALYGGKIDLLEQSIDLGTFRGKGLAARYIVPDSARIAQYGPVPVTPADSTSKPWTVKIKNVDFTGSQALYTTNGVEPLPGLDFTYIQVNDLDLGIRDFYNCATTVKLPLSVSGTERCGVSLNINGNLDIDSEALHFREVKLNTANGTLADFNAILGMGDMTTDPSLPVGLWLDAGFAPADLALMFPQMKPVTQSLPAEEQVQIITDISGTMGEINVGDIDLRVNRCINLHASGSLTNIMDPNEMGGDITLRGNIINVKQLKDKMLDKATAAMINVPPLALGGKVKMRSGVVAGNLKATTAKGSIALDARWDSRREGYNIDINSNALPVNAFLPEMGIGPLTAHLKADGKGYDPFNPKTTLEADLILDNVEYQKVIYKDITGKVSLAEGMATVNLTSTNPDLDLALDAKGNLNGDTYSWDAALAGKRIDLMALGLAKDKSTVEVNMHGNAVIGPGKNDIDGTLTVDDLLYTQPASAISMSDIIATVATSDSTVMADLRNRDLYGRFTAPMGLDSLMAGVSDLSNELSRQLAVYTINMDTLGPHIPVFDFKLTAGSSNFINDYLAPSKMNIRSLNLHADKDSVLHLNGGIRRLQTASMRIDSIYLDGRRHGNHFHFHAGMENKPGNLDQWHQVELQSVISGSTVSMLLHQANLKGQTGFDFGLEATGNIADSTLTVHVKPFNPVIGYQPWMVNDDNYIAYDIANRHINANLHMTGGNSSLAIYTEDVKVTGTDSTTVNQHDIVLKLDDIHIQDWISFNPFAPPMQGDVSTDIRVHFADGHLIGSGSAGIDNFYYNKEKVADFLTNFDVTAGKNGLHAKADLFVNGRKTITVAGALNDSTLLSPMNMDFSMIHFPLEAANPFIPSTVGKLRGTLNGNMQITGSSEHPVFNGFLDFDSTAVMLAMTGVDYTFSDAKIPMVDNVVTLTDFSINGCNENPLRINGTVNMQSLNDIRINLGMKANNMMLVNSNRAKKNADVYGKAYISLDATAKGNMNFLRVNADLSVDPGTNVTYVMQDAESALQSQSKEGMVKFVNFTDTAAVAMADSITQTGMAMFLDANLKIDDGTTINVDLNPKGTNKVQIQSNGNFNYTSTPLDTEGRLTGRLNILEGFVRYTPPFMGEKYFTFRNNSYVAFFGNMMDPTLNIHAVDVMKANVVQDGKNSRMINFDVMLNVTGTLENMNVSFDLATNDDATVANELQSMSPEQRANQAMNMLIYKTYTGPGTKADASLSSNPLFSFLESQINNWAAENIKGVDLSFGIDQYDKTTNGSSSSTMTYSYQVSKSLFDDRFKIVVGGNYSTDANADENFSQNLINDISFEYFLNKTRTMYIRLFRHTGYESILEGEITQTGVGFVYRRKLDRIGDMFLPVKYIQKRRDRQEQERRLQEEQLKPSNSEPSAQ